MKNLVRLLIIVALLVSVGFISTSTTSAQAQTGAVWVTQFFNNPDLSGSPTLTRADTDINFDWGLGSPAPGRVNNDQFSARFVTAAYFTSGNYQFDVRADDGVRVFVDGALLIDTFGAGLPGQTLRATAALTDGNHVIQLEFRELGGEASVSLDWRLSSTPDPTPSEGIWTASYYNNQNLIGAPAFTTQEDTPTNNWGTGSPAGNVLTDNWSARWTSTQTLEAGTYRISVRADDGVRVNVDGVIYINEWHEATGDTYSIDLTLLRGQHTFEVHFYENQGLAFLNYDFGAVSTTPPVAGTFAEITAYALRVRDEASTITGTELTQVQDGQVYPVLDRSADGNWWQIDANGTIGWVYGAYVDVANAQDLPGTTPPSGAVTAEVTPANLNMRAGPALGFDVLRVLPRGTTVNVVGRDPDGIWLRITVDGIAGWVSGRFADLEPGTTVFELPVVS